MNPPPTHEPDTSGAIRGISVSELCIGMFLVEDLYDSAGELLLKGGLKIVSPHQIALAQDSTVQVVSIDTRRGISPADAARGARDAADATPFDDEAEPVGFQQELPAAGKLMDSIVDEAGTVLEAARSGEKTAIDKVKGFTRKIVESVSRNTKALPTLAQIHDCDNYTFKHSVAVGVLSVSLAQALGYDERRMQDVGIAGLLHDIGKIDMPEEMLTKPGRLNANEWRIMQKHPILGAQQIEATATLPSDVVRAVAQHHERPDGSGYPYGLPGSQIHPYAMIVAIAEAYDTMVSAKPYRKAMIPFRAVLEVFRCRRDQFGEQFAYTFIAKVGVYPIGSFVKTSNNELGIVSGHQPQALLHPKVFIVFDSERKLLEPGERFVDLAAAEPDGDGKLPRVTEAGDPSYCGLSARDYLLSLR